MLLHSGDKEINEANVKSVIEAAGIEASDVRIKGLIAALEDVDIDEAIETTALATAPVSGGASTVAEEKTPVQEEEEEEEEEEEASEEEAAAGLGALFG